jgi:hypothetical protein
MTEWCDSGLLFICDYVVHFGFIGMSWGARDVPHCRSSHSSPLPLVVPPRQGIELAPTSNDWGPFLGLF